MPGFPVRGPKGQPRVRLSLRKAAWSASTPINFTGNPGCAHFREERRIKFANATRFYRKSGSGVAWREREFEFALPRRSEIRRRRTMMLTTNFRGLSQKSLTILLALGLLGGAAAAQLGARPSSVHAMMAQTTPAGCVQPGRYQFSQQSGSECAAGDRRRLFAEDH